METDTEPQVVVGVDGVTNSMLGDQDVLVVTQKHQHYPLPIIPALYCKLLLLVRLPSPILLRGFLMPVFHNEETGTSSFSGLQYLHVCVWAVIMLLTWYIKGEHKNSRILGYHDFYNSTRHLHRTTFYITSGGNVILMVLACLVRDYCMGGSASRCSVNISLSPVNYQQIIFLLEVVIAIPFVIKHIVFVVRFNAAAPPDTLADDLAFRISGPESYVGVRGPSSLEWVLERQADLLQVLRHRNSLLTQQVFSLTQQLEQS
ncbi:transmembrane protein 192-like [Portunus trituberculatus]|uniref:transmembrane protein 192-like n=1 Tax=Portunus trituberculatus TaxID=210409 RepID=UPI001E1D173A|nr:transmembrane protein 192-like [Portunus trituberculatus]